MSSFCDDLARLCSREMLAARRDPDRLSIMVERLAHSLAFSISIGSAGNPELSQKLLTAVEGYLYDTSAGLSDIGRAVSE